MSCEGPAEPGNRGTEGGRLHGTDEGGRVREDKGQDRSCTWALRRAMAALGTREDAGCGARRTGPTSGRFPGAPGRAHLIRSVTLAEQRRHLHKRLRFFLRGQSTLSVVRINAESCYLPGVRSFEFNQ